MLAWHKLQVQAVSQHDENGAITMSQQTSHHSTKTKIRKSSLAAGCILAAMAGPASADLDLNYQFVGNGNWSIDAVGGNGSPVGMIQANIPVGATVERAFLYTSLYSLVGPITAPSVTFQGTTYSGAQWTSLGSYQPDPTIYPYFWLGAYRVDVTAQVSALAGGGSGSLFNWVVNSETPSFGDLGVDGEVLAVVYSLPGESYRTIALLDGFSTSAGDSTTVAFANPLTAGQLADPSFEALFSLGIGYSAGGFQYSTVDVNVAGNRLTSSAGGYDDGASENGALITAGGIGDNPANPANPNSTTSPDDELYTLGSFLSAGMTGFTIHTRNPSLDDNIFFAGLNITADARVENSVPDTGSTLSLLGLGLAALAGCRRMKLLAR